MSSLFYILVLTISSIVLASDPQLHQFSENLIQSLSPSGADLKSNQILLQLINGQNSDLKSLIGDNFQHSFQLNITFEGTVTIGAQRNTDNRVQVSTKYLGGLALAVGVKVDDNNVITFDAKPTPVHPMLNNIYETNQKTQKHLRDDETAVLIAHGSGIGFQMTANDHKIQSGLIGGFVVGSKTRVTKSDN